jgi:predicted MFS family arabinose efflux permease
MTAVGLQSTHDETTSAPGSAGGISRYVFAAVLIRLCDEGARVGLVLLALDRTHTAGVGGLLVAALLVPHVAAAPAVGWLVDRSPRPRAVLTGAAVGFAATMAAAGLAVGRLPLWLVVLMLVAGGCCGPALTGGLTSQLSGLVPESKLPRAFGLDSLTYNVSAIAGPALAGLLAGLWSAAGACVALSCVALVGALVLSTLRPRIRRWDAAAPPSMLTGARAIITNPVLATVTAASSAGQLGPGALAVVAAVLATAHHRPSAAGLLLTSVALGAVVGSLWWTWRPASARRSAMTVMVTLIGVGAPLAVSAATTASLPATAGLFAVSGVFIGPFTGALFTVRETNAPTEARAQVFTISAGLKTTSAAAGAALGGAFAGLPLPSQLLLVGASPIVAGSLGALGLSFARGASGRAAGART